MTVMGFISPLYVAAYFASTHSAYVLWANRKFCHNHALPSQGYKVHL